MSENVHSMYMFQYFGHSDDNYVVSCITYLCIRPCCYNAKHTFKITYTHRHDIHNRGIPSTLLILG